MVKFVQEPARDIPVKDEVDILVVGGGPSGIMAARAAAGKGLKVMLIESRGYVGGNLTIGLPPDFPSFRENPESEDRW